MDEPLVASIIIVTYNSAETIRQCLRCVQAFTHTAHEVIVCDNASTDDTVNIVSSEFPEAKLIRNTENLGFAAANNLGASQALGRVLAFINPDLYVSEGWFEPLMDCLESDPDIATISPAIRHLAQPEAIEAIGNQVHLSGLTYLQQIGAASRGKAEVPITAFSGACFVMRREHFEKVGVFCEDHFLYYEDTDLSIRLSMLGLKHLALPAVSVTHDYRPSFAANKVFYLERNRYLTNLSLYPVWALVLSLPAVIFSELMIWAFCLLKGKAYIDAKARACEDIFKRKVWLQERRRRFRGSHKVSDAWLAGLSPFINLQYLRRGFVSHVAEAVLFIVAVPFVGILRLVILINGTEKS
jgi:N-acetylglucosaminyl-diphospho-decaprenol L-rhamnosyltransferase